MKKHRVTVVVRSGNRNYGYSVAVKASETRIRQALDMAYGSNNILMCTIKEVG